LLLCAGLKLGSALWYESGCSVLGEHVGLTAACATLFPANSRRVASLAEFACLIRRNCFSLRNTLDFHMPTTRAEMFLPLGCLQSACHDPVQCVAVHAVILAVLILLHLSCSPFHGFYFLGMSSMTNLPHKAW
jgi:hypothetical protein